MRLAQAGGPSVVADEDAAASNGAPSPVTDRPPASKLSFIDAATRAPSFTPCYIGDDTLVGSLWRTLTGPRITVVVSYGAPQQSGGRDRRAWAADLRTAVDALRRC